MERAGWVFWYRFWSFLPRWLWTSFEGVRLDIGLLLHGKSRKYPYFCSAVLWRDVFIVFWTEKNEKTWHPKYIIYKVNWRKLGEILQQSNPRLSLIFYTYHVCYGKKWRVKQLKRYAHIVNWKIQMVFFTLKIAEIFFIWKILSASFVLKRVCILPFNVNNVMKISYDPRTREMFWAWNLYICC